MLFHIATTKIVLHKNVQDMVPHTENLPALTKYLKGISAMLEQYMSLTISLIININVFTGMLGDTHVYLAL